MEHLVGFEAQENPINLQDIESTRKEVKTTVLLSVQ